MQSLHSHLQEIMRGPMEKYFAAMQRQSEMLQSLQYRVRFASSRIPLLRVRLAQWKQHQTTQAAVTLVGEEDERPVLSKGPPVGRHQEQG